MQVRGIDARIIKNELRRANSSHGKILYRLVCINVGNIEDELRTKMVATERNVCRLVHVI